MKNEVFTFIAGVCLGGMITMFVTMYAGHEWHKDIVEQGCGQYNSKTGIFEFKINN